MIKLLNKLFFAKIHIQFIVFFVIIAPIVWLVFVFPMSPEQHTHVSPYIGVPLVSFLFSFLITFMSWFSKKGLEFSDTLSLIEKKVEEAKTAEELLAVKNELIEFHNKKAGFRQQGDQCRRIRDIINSRLVHEFGYVKNTNQ